MVHSRANWPRPKLILNIQKMEIFKAPLPSLIGENQVETRLFGIWNCYSEIDTLMEGKTASAAGIEV